MAQTPPGDLDALLQHAILPGGLPVTEAQNYCEPKVPRMPVVKNLAQWQALADQMRRDALEKVVFRGAHHLHDHASLDTVRLQLSDEP